MGLILDVLISEELGFDIESKGYAPWTQDRTKERPSISTEELADEDVTGEIKELLSLWEIRDSPTLIIVRKSQKKQLKKA
jgi:hypothetical protein